MAEHKNLTLNPNDPPAYVELLFDTPKDFPSRSRYAKPGEKTYKFSVRMLDNFAGSKTVLGAGEEAGFWLDNEHHVRALSAFRKGDHVSITRYKNPDMSYADFKFAPIATPASATKPSLYSEARSLEPQAEEGQPEEVTETATPVGPITMREALIEAFAAIVGAAKYIAESEELGGAEGAGLFHSLMLARGEELQKMAVTIYMRGTRG